VIAHVDRVLGLLEAGKLDPAPLVTHRAASAGLRLMAAEATGEGVR
jgi:hypothetical protein